MIKIAITFILNKSKSASNAMVKAATLFSVLSEVLLCGEMLALAYILSSLYTFVG